MLATRAQVPAKQVVQSVHTRPGDVWHEPGRRAERELHEPGGHLVGVDGLDSEPGGTGTTGSLAIPRAVVSIRSWNWVARSVVHGRPDSATTRSAASFDAT